jgi:hypothetical protein
MVFLQGAMVVSLARVSAELSSFCLAFAGVRGYFGGDWGYAFSPASAGCTAKPYSI